MANVKSLISYTASQINCHQRRRLAAGLAFEKRRARLQSPVLQIEL